MLLFSTVLDVKESVDHSAFRKMVVEWNERFQQISDDNGEVHYTENHIPDFSWNREKSLKCGSENLWIAAEEYENEDIIAVRYEKREADGIIWDTDYVMNFKKHKLSVRLERSYTEDANLKGRDFSSPYFISILIRNDVLPMDGDLPTLYRPILINDDNIDLLAGVVKGEKRYKMPVLFVSKNQYGNDPVNVKDLARRLKGIAHVLVQEDRASNEKIREACEENNEYNGTIGVYFPNPSIKKGRYFSSNPSETEFDENLMERVIQRVLQYCNSIVVDPLYTWQGVNNALLLSNLESQRHGRQEAEAARRKAEDEVAQMVASLDDEQKRITEEAIRKATDEANRLIEEFDEENARLRERIEVLSRDNDRLRYENDGLNAKISRLDNVPVLVFGNEHDLWTGEIKDVVLTTLEESLVRFQDDSRRKHVILDLLAHNDFEHRIRDREAKLHVIMTGYKRLDQKTKSTLEEIGFEITGDKTHYKFLYGGDARYCVTLPKTGGDGAHGGKNAGSVMINLSC